MEEMNYKVFETVIKMILQIVKDSKSIDEAVKKIEALLNK